MTCEFEPPCAARLRSGLRPRAVRGASVVLLAFSVLVAGCSRGLEPAEWAASNMPDTAYAAVAGVGVRTKTGWRGEPGVEEFVTPVHVEIDNGSPGPLRIRYSGIWLQSADGQIFRALPPFDVRRTVWAKLEPIIPKFRQRDAAVAPYLGPIYEGVEVEPPAAEGEYPYDYAQLYDRWREGSLRPTRYMQEVALPEARVRPGGELSGFVYFERVPASEVQAILKLELVHADSGERLGVAKISLTISARPPPCARHIERRTARSRRATAAASGRSHRPGPPRPCRAPAESPPPDATRAVQSRVRSGSGG